MNTLVWADSVANDHVPSRQITIDRGAPDGTWVYLTLAYIVSRSLRYTLAKGTGPMHPWPRDWHPCSRG